ncbi:MAG: hypothetical protein IJ914_02605 [Prevotella sp.]|nr:hypothetical protein [Prevotella sp.]
MKYDISKKTAPAMPNLGRGTESIKILLSQVSKDMHEPLVPMLFPILGAHVSNTEFQYPDLTWKELCGQMANLVADSGCNKGQLSLLVEALCRDFRHHDEEELRRLVEWQKQVKTRGANKEKPVRPEVAFWFPPSDMTRAAFLQNSVGCESLGERTQYLNLPEVEMLDSLCGGHKQVTQMLRNIYDRQRTGALRATADGVVGNPLLRTCLTVSSTPIATRKFWKGDLFNGTFGRMVFSYKPRLKREDKIPRVGKFPDEFYRKIDEYLVRLNITKGRFIIRPLNKLIDSLAADMASLGDLTDDDVLWDISKRSLVSAWKAGCTLWMLNNQTWSKPMGDLVEWLVYHDLWSKLRIAGDLLKEGDTSTTNAAKSGPKNILNDLPKSFNEAQLIALRESIGKSREGTKNLLNVWKFRGFITYSNQTGLYTKTDEYLSRMQN